MHQQRSKPSEDQDVVEIDVVESPSENGASPGRSLVDAREAGFEGLEDIKVGCTTEQKGPW